MCDVRCVRCQTSLSPAWVGKFSPGTRVFLCAHCSVCVTPGELLVVTMPGEDESGTSKAIDPNAS